MRTKLFRIECEPECGFVVQSHEERDVVTFTTLHVRYAHGKELTPQEVRGAIKTA